MRTLAGLMLALTMAAGCTNGSDPEPSTTDAPLPVTWREAALPQPPGRSGRIAVRDAVTCGGQQHITGAVFFDDGSSKPAAWRSEDGRVWTPLTFKPRTYWGHRAVIYSASCRDGQLALLGAKSGGAHGNPRVTTWYPRDDGVFVDVDARFELYGGPRAVSVERMAAGETGWMIAGNRMSGAAVWISGDARDFTLVDSDPQLSSDPEVDTAARDVVHADGVWTVVGNAALDGRVARVPMSWTSADGRVWTRQRMPTGDGYTDAQRVIAFRAGVYAMGLLDDAFAAWRRTGADGKWRRAARFGGVDPDGRASPFVSGLTRAGDGLVAAVSDQTRYQLWASPDGKGWRPVKTPTRPTTAGEHLMTATGVGEQVILLADDGKAGRAWIAEKINFRS
ncbi:MAG: hypothetical protein GEU94_02100 [Micromonosporaceae bacterium]|nr:hypothetical protein [Micromonosporaceae bacterium]